MIGMLGRAYPRRRGLSVAVAAAISALVLIASSSSGKTEDKKTEARVPQTTPPAPPILIKGMASFYGNDAGGKTASGQRFNQNALTAAHRTLPFGTKLKVTYQGRSVVVTVTDRRPFTKGRVLDVSAAAARAIGLTDRGVGSIVAEVQ